MYRLGIILLFTVIIILSCEKEITFKFDDNERKLVLNSIITTDSLFTVYLSESIYPNESFFNQGGISGSYNIINNAVISLFSDENLIGYFKYNSGCYVYEDFPQLNREYTLKVSADNYPTIQTTTKLSCKVVIDSVKLINIIEGENVFYNLNIKLYFSDPPNQNNYYYLIVLYNYYKLNIGTFAGRNMFVSNDPVFSDHIDSKQFFIFNDNLINGESYGLNIDVTTNTDAIYDSIQYYFYLCSLNYDYYKYLESYNSQVLTTDPDHNPIPLTEPIQFYNNIENGYGIFAGFQVSVDSLLYNNP